MKLTASAVNSAALFVGIDPGAHGAIAFYDPTTDALDVHDMPTHQVKIAGKNKTRIDMYGLGVLIDCRRNAIRTATIELVTSSPQMGVASAFAFGEAYGAARMAVAANIVPSNLVRPQEWKAHFRLIGKDKDASRAKASTLLPNHAKHWQLKKHDGRAEAALLALYGEYLSRSR